MSSPPPKPTATNATFRWAAALACITAVVFVRVVGFGWAGWDDELHVIRNPGLNPVSVEGVAGFWTAPYEGLYIPLSYMLFAGETLLSRAVVAGEPTAAPDPRLFHGVSILLHVVCVMLVWRLLAGAVGGEWPPVAGALLFALHPLQVETVAWISEQRGLLATALSLAAMQVAGTGGRTKPPPSGRWHDACGLALFGLAMLAKPQAIIVPALLALLAGKGSWAAVVAEARRLWSWFLLAAVVAVVTKIQQPGEWSWRGAEVALVLRPLVAGDALCFYAEKMLVPVGLCLDHGRTPAVVLADPFLCCRAVMAILVVAGVMTIPRLRAARIPVGLAVVALLPVLGLIPFTFQGFSTVADRYAYLPMIGPAFGLAMIVAWAERPVRTAVLAGIVGWLGMLAALTLVQMSVWRDREALNTHIVSVNPRSSAGRLGLAGVLIEEGRLPEAAEVLRGAVAVNPDYAKARYELGSTLHKLGKNQEAEEEYRQAIRLRPSWSYAHNDLGILLAEEGRLEEAVRHFRTATALRPDVEAHRLNLDRAEAARGLPDPRVTAP